LLLLNVKLLNIGTPWYIVSNSLIPNDTNRQQTIFYFYAIFLARQVFLPRAEGNKAARMSAAAGVFDDGTPPLQAVQAFDCDFNTEAVTWGP